MSKIRTVFNAKKRIKHFMREKSDYLEELTGIELYVESDIINDYEDMKGHHKKALINMKDIIYYSVYDSGCCPQCMSYEACMLCPYGSNHGICDTNESDNTYGVIVNMFDMKQSITDIIGTETMKRFIKWL